MTDAAPMLQLSTAQGFSFTLVLPSAPTASLPEPSKDLPIEPVAKYKGKGILITAVPVSNYPTLPWRLPQWEPLSIGSTTPPQPIKAPLINKSILKKLDELIDLPLPQKPSHPITTTKIPENKAEVIGLWVEILDIIKLGYGGVLGCLENKGRLGVLLDLVARSSFDIQSILGLAAVWEDLTTCLTTDVTSYRHSLLRFANLDWADIKLTANNSLIQAKKFKAANLREAYQLLEGEEAQSQEEIKDLEALLAEAKR